MNDVSAARLMCVAGDGIICDEVTATRAASRFQFYKMPPIRVKGKEDMIEIYAPTLTKDFSTTAKASVSFICFNDEPTNNSTTMEFSALLVPELESMFHSIPFCCCVLIQV
jgi:hypothetical protein